MLTNSYSPYEGYFSSSDSSKESDKGTSKSTFEIKRKQDRINKKKQEDMELDKIIKRIEDDHSSWCKHHQKSKKIERDKMKLK